MNSRRRPRRPLRASRVLAPVILFPVVACLDRDGAARPDPGADGAPPPDAVFRLSAEDLPRATLVEELRLDAEQENLSVVRWFSVGPDGRIALPLRQDGHIRVYDASGTHLGTFGRSGEGPGEFTALGTVGFIADTLWGRDARSGRMSWFGPDGSVLRTWTPETIRLEPPDSGSAPLEMPAVFFSPGAMAADGSFLGTGRYMYPDFSRVSQTLVVSVRPGGTARHVATPLPYEDPRWMIEVEGLGWPMPFAAAPMSSIGADAGRFAGLHVDRTDETGGDVVITLIEATGDTAFSRTYPFVGEPVPSSARDSAIAALRPEGRTPSEGPPDLYRRRQDIARERMPAVYPPVTGFRLGLDETIWVDLRGTAEGQVTVVLDGHGRPIASVLVPEGVVIEHASRERAWGIHTDALGLTSVVRYRVEGMR